MGIQFLKKYNKAALLSLAISLPVLLSCFRDNPVDAKSSNYIAAKKPHVFFLTKELSTYLLDPTAISLTWSDTAAGGLKGAIKKVYFDWNGDATFEDSIDGIKTDTFTVTKTFPPGVFIARVKAVDVNDLVSDQDSIRLNVKLSKPRIDSVWAPISVEKLLPCTLSVFVSDSGGVAQTLVWAMDGARFSDTTAVGMLSVNFVDSGTKLILVKVLDNKKIESAIDSITIHVFAKTFSVRYDGNGNTGGIVPIDSNKYTQGSQVLVLSNSGNLVKDGYIFTGWVTDPFYRGANYSPGVYFLMENAGVTLYAQWTANPTYSITYNGNGNTKGSVPIDTAYYSLGQSAPVLGNSGNLEKSGYTFIGWNTQSDGSGSNYATGVSFIMGSSNATLYAQWTAQPTYTVLYDGNGNANGAAPLDNNNYLAGATVTTLGNSGALAKSGFTFVGWNTKTNGSGTHFATGVTFTIGAANVILYAQWTANPTYTIFYEGNGSTAGKAPTDANNYSAGATVTAVNPGSLVKTGYYFTGWNTESNGSGSSYSVGATFVMGGANDTLYAQWSIIQTYTVTYNGNGNAGGNVPIDTSHYLLGGNVKVLGNTAALIKTGKAFSGWNTQADGAGAMYMPGAAFVIGSQNVTLYAVWKSIYMISYDSNGASSGTVPTDTIHYIFGQEVVTSQNTGALVKAGFTFIGWNTKNDGTGISYSAGASFIMDSSNVLLFANWTALPTYSVFYDANGGSGSITDPNQYLAGSSAKVLGQGSLLKAEYTFSGWTRSSGGTGKVYSQNDTLTISAGAVTLFAKWTTLPAPTLISPSDGATGQSTSPTLSWNSVANATTYQIQISAFVTFSSIVLQDSTLAAPSKTISGLANYTQYYWRVRASNASGPSAWSEIRSLTTVVAAPTLTVPANGAIGQPTSPTLAWNTVAGAATYHVQVSTSSAFSPILTQDSTITGASKVISGLSNNITYYWQVRAKNAGGSGAWSETRSFTTIVVAPTLNLPANGASGQPTQPTLTWNTVSGALTYHVQVSTVSNFSSIVTQDSTLTIASATISNLANNVTYYWRVRAKNTGGAGGWSSIRSFTTIDITPPTVGSTIPASGATGVSPNGSMSATFSKPMNPATITAASFTLKQGAAAIAGTVTYNAATNTATITPNLALGSLTMYTATITTDVTDIAGNHLASANSWSFTTADVTTPTVQSWSPATNATGVPILTNITATFSKAMNVNTITTASFTLTPFSGSAVDGSISYAPATNTATFTPTVPLVYNTNYTATITTGVKDAVGNAMGSPYIWSFTTLLPTVQFSATTQSLNENSGVVTVTASLSGVSGLPVTVPIAFSGTATGGGTDYLAAASSITIPAGNTTGTIDISVVDDLIHENDETVVLTMSTPTNATLGANTVHTLTIIDNDAAPTVQFNASTESKNEGDGTVTVTASLSGVSGLPVTVPIAFSGTATGSGTDYSVSSSSISIPAGSTAGTIDISVIDDHIHENDETVVLTMGTPANATLDANSVHTLTIIDNDAAPTVQFNASTESKNEGVGTVTVTASLSAVSGLPVTVPITFSGTATGSGTDYSVSSSSISIPAGSTAGTIDISVIDDHIHENDETVVLTMGTPANATLDANSVYTLTIADNDPSPTVQFVTTAQSKDESIGIVTVTASLSAVSGLPVTVPIAFSGTATGSGIDYSVSSSSISIPAGSMTGTIDISVIDDQIHENDETVVLTMGTPANATLDANSGYTLTINDNDYLPTVSSTNPTNGVTEMTPPDSLSVTFSKPMDETTITTSTFIVVDGSSATVTGSVSYQTATNTATFKPAFPFVSGTNYSITISSNVADVATNKMGNDFMWTFSIQSH